MPRSQVREVSPANAIRPVASPVDTFVRPAEPAPSPLHDVAEGLSALDAGLRGFLQKRQAQADEADKVRGQAAFYKNNQQGYAEAVRQGLIPANSSPVFVESYKQAQGNLAGIRLREKFNQAYLSWEGRNGNDPAAFETFLSDFIGSNIGTEDPDVLRGLNPHLEALTTDAMSVWGKERAESTYRGSLETRGAVSGETIDYAEANSLSTGQGIDQDSLWADLMAQRAEAIAAGHREADFNKVMVDTIVDKAIEHGNPELLDLLDRTLPGQSVKLSSLPEFRDLKQAGVERLTTLARQRMQDRDQAAIKENKAREDAIVRTVATEMAKDPSVEVPEDIIKEWERYDPLARKKLVEMRRTLLDAAGMEDPRDLLAVERAIQDGATTADILRLVKDGVIRDPGTLKNAIDRVEKRQKARLEGQGILTTQTAKRITSTLRERTLPNDIDAMFDPGGTSDEGLEAIRDFEGMLIEWEVANPNATLADRERAINEIGELILKRVNTEDRTYTSSKDAEAMLAQQEQASNAATLMSQSERQQNQLGSLRPRPEEAQEAEGGAGRGFWSLPSRQDFKDAMEIDAGLTRPRQNDEEAHEKWTIDETQRLYQGDSPPSLEDMDNSYRRRLEDEAGKAGMTPEEYNMEIWKRLKNALLGGGGEGSAGSGFREDPEANVAATPASVAIEETFDLGGTIDNAVNAGAGVDRSKEAVSAVKPIFDLIAHTEGTDRRRGYNETLAYGLLTDGDVDLVNMTLGEIDKLQTSMLRHPENKWNSSALGRYQIVRKTLRSLKKQLGLTDDMKFDEALQDRLALALLDGRGYSKWLRGEMSDAAFFNGLSKEWASLPNAKGSGSYAGQRVGTDLEGLRSALVATRQNRVADQTTPLAYSNIPDAEVHQFMEWNSDPIANHEANLKSIDAGLSQVVRRAQEIAKVKFVVGSGKRDAALQRKAVEWGWSKTEDSDHLHGGAVDLWPLDENGAVKFDKKLQLEIVKAMKQAAKELGVDLDIGEEWKSFKDLPHFAIKKGGAVAV